MAEPKFVIQGVDYPVPDWISFTIDESVILYDKAGLTLDQIDEDIKFTPGLLQSLMIVAYLRGNPGAPRARAEKIIGGMAMTDIIETLFPDVEEDAGPPSPAPSETKPPGEQESSDESQQSSGEDSGNGSENAATTVSTESLPAVVHLPTGTHESHTPVVDSDRATSAG